MLKCAKNHGNWFRHKQKFQVFKRSGLLFWLTLCTNTGVVEEEGAGENGESTRLAASVWYEMRNSGHLQRDDIDVIFTRVQPRHDVTVDNVIECTYGLLRRLRHAKLIVPSGFGSIWRNGKKLMFACRVFCNTV